MPRKTIEVGGKSRAFDARPDRLDLRDRMYSPALGSLPSRWPSDAVVRERLPAYAAAGLIRDQGQDGACTGFGLATVIDYLNFAQTPVATDPEAAAPTTRRASASMLYELARLYDEWPGEEYEGSSCRGALKGWQRHGVCREELWPYKLHQGKRVFVRPSEDEANPDDATRNWDVDALRCTLGVYYRIDARSVVDMQAAILQVGAIYCSGNVHEGWNVKGRRNLEGHGDLPAITLTPEPKAPGGHAFAIVGYNEQGFVVQNSWGKGWGASGFALLPYADWVMHGEDAWVFTLGVPAAGAPRESESRSARSGNAQPSIARAPSYIVASGNQAPSDPTSRTPNLVGASDALQRRYKSVPAHLQPLDTNAAYRHALVLDRGFPIRNDVTAPNAQGAVERVSYDCPSRWLTQHNSDKLMIYAHGGLNSESASITRARAIAPYALSEGIYPLFITWRSGPGETIVDIAQEGLAKLGFGARGTQPAAGWLDRVTDKTDRLLEPLMRGAGGALWGQMKLNAVRASEHEAGGVRAMVQHLARLKAARPKLEIHLVGHSAGSIVLGAMLTQMQAVGLKAASLRLFAPACTLEFALQHYKPAVETGTLDPRRWHIHNLSDTNEQRDSVGPYQKSLLYLVSRSFEDTHKTPLLGFDKAFDRRTLQAESADDAWAAAEQATARKWLHFWTGLGIDDKNRKAHVLSASRVSNGVATERASHGCFDNAVDIIGKALGYVVSPSKPAKVAIHRLDY